MEWNPSTRVEDMVRELGEAKGCLENWVLLGKGLNQAGVFDLDDLRDQDVCDGEVFDGVVNENNLGPGYRKLFEKKIGFKFDDRIAEDGAHAHKALKAAKKQVKRPGPCRACTLGCLASFFFSFFHKVEGVCSHWCVLACAVPLQELDRAAAEGEHGATRSKWQGRDRGRAPQGSPGSSL